MGIFGFHHVRKVLLFLFFGFLRSPLSAQPIDSVKVGNGGGFTGQSTVFTWHKKEMARGSERGTLGSTLEKATLSCKQSHALKKKANAIWSKEGPFEHPSNTFKWIEVYSKGQVKKYVWGDPAFSTPSSLQEYYSQFMDIVKTLSFKK